MNNGTIIFDFDGTIADSMELVLELFYEITGHERLTKAEIAELRSLTVPKILKRLGVSLRHGPQLLVKGRALMRQRIDDIKVFQGLPAVLKRLHDDGWQLIVISSNSYQNIETYLDTHGLRDYFDRIYGSVKIFGKTQALRKVLKQDRLDRRSCFYVGDEVRDMQAARRARVRGVAVAWGYNDASILAAENPFAIAQTSADLVRIFAKAKPSGS
jgi:phosphoglycolate phosphatase